jgi:membrane protein
VFSYFGRLYDRFRQENFAQLAGSLAFTTLLSLVPFVAIVLTVASTLPAFATLVGYVDNFFVDNLMPGKTGGVVAKYMAGFSTKARKLTFVGAIMLLATSLLLLFSIEKAFNHLWRVKKPRPLLQRAGLYLVIVAGGPVVVGAVIASMTYAVTVSLGFFNEPLWVRQLSYKVLALTVLCGFFAFLYYAVPNTRVRPWHALIGGIVSTAGIAVIQKLFEIYVIKFPTYTVVYGAFAVLPIFLLWVYLCWVVVLVGALVVANFRASGPGR